MKKLFLTIAAILCIASAFTVMTLRERSKYPVIVWAASQCQDRVDQIAVFHKWLIKNGYTDKDGNPLFTVALETANNQSSLIQAVSGIAGDLIDYVPVKRFAPMGVLEDITDFARENKLDPKNNYGQAGGLLMYEDRQYAYACNLAARALMCNDDVFRQYGMDPPPEEWTPDQFEEIGTEFIRRANAENPQQRIFFAGAMPQMILPLARSAGADVFNETLTAPTLTDPAFLNALARYHKWVAELRLIPSGAEIASESADVSSVNGESTPQLVSGRYAMISTGRYVNMDLRRFKTEPIHLSFVQFPEHGYKNLILYSRNTAIYKGSKHKDFAKIFLLFLADKEYNETIIRSSDGLPPNPKCAENNPEYLNPPGHKNEGNLHANELKWARTIAIPESLSPYYPLADNKISYAYGRVSSGLSSPEEALGIANQSIEYAIKETVDGTASLREKYKSDCELQKKIDEYKAAGRKLPAAWIKNPFYLKFYSDTGRLKK